MEIPATGVSSLTLMLDNAIATSNSARTPFGKWKKLVGREGPCSTASMPAAGAIVELAVIPAQHITLQIREVHNRSVIQCHML